MKHTVTITLDVEVPDYVLETADTEDIVRIAIGEADKALKKSFTGETDIEIKYEVK